MSSVSPFSNEKDYKTEDLIFILISSEGYISEFSNNLFTIIDEMSNDDDYGKLSENYDKEKLKKIDDFIIGFNYKQFKRESEHRKNKIEGNFDLNLAILFDSFN